MRYLGIAVLAAGLALTSAGCATHAAQCSVIDPDPGSSARLSRFEVAMLEFHFKPESLNVAVGDTVTWVNHGKIPHTVTSGIDGKADGQWNSGEVTRGGSFSHVFTESGTYRYYCVPHHSLGMKGVVVVTGR